MAALGLEFLRFLDGQQERQREERAILRHQELLNTVVKGSLVATTTYDEKKVFPEYFPDQEPTEESSDENVDFDYSGVQWETPAEDEMAILRRMLGDNSVTVPGSSLPDEEDAYDVPMALPDQSPVMDQIENNQEWV